MIFSYNWLQSFFSEKLPPINQLADIIMKHGFEVEVDGQLMDIDVLPNRAPDCFSHWGISREIAVMTGLPMADYQKEKKQEFKFPVEVDKKICSRYCLLALDVEDIPEINQEYLTSCGVGLINPAVDLVNYIMLETGQPLHAFDLDKIEGKIFVRWAKKEKIKALDNNTYQLNENIPVIADEKKVLSIAGIKGGQAAEVDKNTKRILIEAASFDPIIIRRAARQLKIKTDASSRFEQGPSAELVSVALNLIPGGQISDWYPCPEKEKKIKIDLEKIEQLLGIKVPGYKKILTSLGFKVDDKVTVPYWRKDISCNADLAEEIGRIYGYDKIEAEIPSFVPSITSPSVEEEIRDFLVSAGFHEAYTSSFSDKGEIKVIKPEWWLRSSLMDNIAQIIPPKTKMFEIGTVFGKKEERRVVLATRGYDWPVIKGVANELGLNKFKKEKDIFLAEGKVQKREIKFKSWPRYPSVLRDLAVLVPVETEVGEVIDKIKDPLIQKVELFDIYQGKNIPDNKKNLAFRISYGSLQGTLKAEEAEKVHQIIIRKMEEKWIVRK